MYLPHPLRLIAMLVSRAVAWSGTPRYRLCPSGHAAGVFFCLMIAAPVVFGLLLVDIGSGLLARNMPQVSIYFVMMPAKILLGLSGLAQSEMAKQIITKKITGRTHTSYSISNFRLT